MIVCGNELYCFYSSVSLEVEENVIDVSYRPTLSDEELAYEDDYDGGDDEESVDIDLDMSLR